MSTASTAWRTPDYLHPLAKPILEETYGVIIYQEQVMQLAQVLSGYSLGEADLLRRAMGKKIKAEMDAQGVRFVKGALEKDIPEARARYIFELVAKFAGYGFNKSHAAAYALVAYQTAYLKANHALEFIAASMTLDMGNTDKLYGYTREAKRLGMAILPPSVNKSAAEFLPEGNGIRYALGALKNMGQAAAEHIVEERGGKPYRDLADFMSRINPKTVNKRAIEALNAAGALEDLEKNRAKVAKNAERLIEFAARLAQDRQAGQADMFGAAAGGSFGAARALGRARLGPARNAGRRACRGGLLPFRPSARRFHRAARAPQCDALDRVQPSARRPTAAPRAALPPPSPIASTARRNPATRFAFAGFSDPTGQFEAVIFSDTLELAGDKLEAGKNVLISVEGEAEGEAVKVRVQAVQSLDEVLGKGTKQIAITATERLQIADLMKHLGREGSLEIKLVVELREQARAVEFSLGSNFSVSARQLSALKTLPGVVQVS